jgi:hypothetical protein
MGGTVPEGGAGVCDHDLELRGGQAVEELNLFFHK